MPRRELLKKDLFGEVWLLSDAESRAILRDTSKARWWTVALARWLMRREARALAVLNDCADVPGILSVTSTELTREYIDGSPLYAAGYRDPGFFAMAARLLRKLHRAGIVHNDLAKEPNILVRPDGTPAFIDFQLAAFSAVRGRLFRIAAREDIRHLLKHKRSYEPQALTQRERSILQTPAPLSRIWMGGVKPIYLFVTRRLLGWADREGAADRGRND